MAMEPSPPIDPLDRLPLEIWNERIFPLVPHVSRLRCQCVSSKWYRVLKAQELAARAKPSPVWCLAIFVDVRDTVPMGPGMFAREGGPLRCIAISPYGGMLHLPQLTFPPDWRPERNGGGFRAGGGLVAYFCEGYYRVGNPVHNMWEKVKSEMTRLRFKRNSFALVVDECAGSYEIVAYGMNDKIPGSHYDWMLRAPPPDDDRDRDHDNWFIQVYSSKSRTWRVGATLDQQVFRALCDVCVFERTVYFLGWTVPPPRCRGTLAWHWNWPFADPTLQEQCKMDHKLAIWAYDLDSNTLREVVSPAQFYGGPGAHWNFPNGPDTYLGSLQLLVSREPGRKPSSLQFNLVVARSVSNGSSRGPFCEKLFRLRLDETDPSLRFWVTEDVVGIDELVAGGPKAVLAADTWGVGVVAYSGCDLFRPEDENPMPVQTLRILCYNRDEQKWMDWYGYESCGMLDMNKAAAVGFVACECCRGELTSAGPFDHVRSIPRRP